MTNRDSPSSIEQRIAEIYRTDSRRVYAALVRLLSGDFDLAEESMHEAFTIAVERWTTNGVPENPYAWLVSTGRFKAIDTIRRNQRFSTTMSDIAREQNDTEDIFAEHEPIDDDRLRMIFTCCHPALAEDARVALTLREVCGLTTEEIARAYLTAPSTLAQRIVRAKSKIRNDRIPYQIPEPDELPARIDTVLRVIYLVFNGGYTASSGPSLTRPDLSGEAIRLGRLLTQLLGDFEIKGLLALMLLNEGRRPGRVSPAGDLVPLEEQDRSLWDKNMMTEGCHLTRDILASGTIGPYTLQAAIATEHAKAQDTASTDWSRIVALYELLNMIAPSSVVELNLAVAMAMRDGPETGLARIDAILDRGELTAYHLAHAARADLLRRMKRVAAAKAAYRQALELGPPERERQFLKRRLTELSD